VDGVLEVARRLGIRSPLRREYALALGVSEVTLLELTAAYAALANGGSRVTPHAILRVEGPGGALLEEYRPAVQPALKEEVAYLLTSVLQGAVERGTGQKAQALDRPAAGKTGTSQDAADLWFVGYTPDLAAGVWLGYDAPRSLGPHETAGRLAAPLWADFMRRALASRPPTTFAVPEGVFFLDVDARTGAPVPPGSPGAVREVFLRGEGSLGAPPGAGAYEAEPEEAVEEEEGSTAQASP
jgi:penicillin-binding protein 1A